MRKRDGGSSAEEAAKEKCPVCRHWRPAVLTDSLGVIRGSRCCFCNDARDDGSCFEPREKGEQSEEREDQ